MIIALMRVLSATDCQRLQYLTDTIHTIFQVAEKPFHDLLLTECCRPTANLTSTLIRH